MKILLTGGAGFIGSHTAVELINNGYSPIILDDFRNSNALIIKNIEKIIGKKVGFYSVDIGNKIKLREIIKKENPIGIIHFAADKSVNESVLNPLKYYKNNISNLVSLIELVSEFNINSFVFSSSCTVYGNPIKIPVKETNETQPAFSPYGYTKQVGERILTDFCAAREKLSLTLLRYFNPIGAHPSGLIGELPIGVPSNLLPLITQTAIGKRKKLTIYGNDYETPDGTCIRDYIHVVDLANAHVLSLKFSLEKKNYIKTYNVGMGKGSSVLEVINSFENVNKVAINYDFGARRIGDIPKIFADVDLIKNEMNWFPKFNLENSVEHAWNWEKKLMDFKYIS